MGKTVVLTGQFCLSAFEVKKNNNCCLFERLFKVKKNRVFLFGICVFVLEIFTFLTLMTSLVVPLKQYNTKSRISLEILKQCS